MERKRDYQQTLTHNRPTWTHPIPSLAVNPTSSGQEFRGQTLECCYWRTCSHGGRCRSNLGLIKWQQTGKEKRLRLVIRSVQLCVWVAFICAHMLLLFAEKKMYWLSGKSECFWHWSLPHENWERAGRIGGSGGTNTSAPLAVQQW